MCLCGCDTRSEPRYDGAIHSALDFGGFNNVVLWVSEGG